MKNATNELITDIKNIQENINGSDGQVSTAINILKVASEEVNDFNENNIEDIRQVIKLYRAYMREYKERGYSEIYNLIRDKLLSWCDSFYEVADILGNIAQSNNAKIIAFRVKADIHRYRAEFHEDNLEKYTMDIQQALITYYSSMEIAKLLPIENVNRLGVTLNYCVLLSDELKDIDKSISLLKESLDALSTIKSKVEEVEIIESVMAENLQYYEQNRKLYLAEKNKIKY